MDTVEGKAALTDILLYHVVSGEVPSSAVTECANVALEGGPRQRLLNAPRLSNAPEEQLEGGGTRAIMPVAIWLSCDSRGQS